MAKGSPGPDLAVLARRCAAAEVCRPVRLQPQLARADAGWGRAADTPDLVAAVHGRLRLKLPDEEFGLGLTGALIGGSDLDGDASGQMQLDRA